MGPIYEVTFVVRNEVRDDFESWLRSLRNQAVLQDGIDDVRSYESDSGDNTFTVTIRFASQDDGHLDTLLDNFFSDADADLAERFGEAVEMSGRVLREDTASNIPGADHPNCLNCGTRLRGQYCGSCGQRARSRLISMWELTREAFGDLFELDSRLWRTLVPLLIRPGLLTKDYLEGRRARYMPPFRMYLVLSVIFFVVAFFNPREDLALLYEPEPEPTPEEIAAAAADDEAQEAQAQEGLEQARTTMERLNEEGIITDEALDEFIKEVDDDDEESGGAFNITVDGDGERNAECTVDTSDLESMPAWIQRRATPERLKKICERITLDEGETFIDLLLDRIPVGLIVLLPIMALVLKMLYPLSRRYFVEHLLFFIHFHAFIFLMLTLQILFARLGYSLPFVPEAITVLVLVAASFYVPVYLYKAMRKVYGQGHLITIFKYVLLQVAYWLGLTMTLIGAMLFALISVGE